MAPVNVFEVYRKLVLAGGIKDGNYAAIDTQSGELLGQAETPDRVRKDLAVIGRKYNIVRLDQTGYSISTP